MTALITGPQPWLYSMSLKALADISAGWNSQKKKKRSDKTLHAILLIARSPLHA